ncbi:hypothetical protein [Deinococcus koreensis]|uniref:Uncharacterized protein n=1 Tax=Deinococcus koreensis TaxID=2054903 RepID=A0A2K3UZT8_9DEIO|nr:hypothetical protein [Deinococcus koreensis]PNY82043.1 hypothetical protein CVO96_12290 [Deinococcus koreensis]
MTDLTRDSGNAAAPGGYPDMAERYGKVRWWWSGEFITPTAHVRTEREVRDARQQAAQSTVERLTR